MNLRPLLVFAAIAALLIGFIYWQEHVTPPPAKVWNLDKSIAGVMARFGLTDKALEHRAVIAKKYGKTKYPFTDAVYNAPKGFSWKSFMPEFRTALRKTPFRVSKSDEYSTREAEIYSLMISRDSRDLMSIKINKRKEAVVREPAVKGLPKETAVKEAAVRETTAKESPAKEAAVPRSPAVKGRRSVKVAIVIDDFGYSMNNIPTFLGIKEPLNFSVLPNQRYSREVANEAHSAGHEVLLHLPLEALNKEAVEETGTIRSGMNEKDVTARLNKDLAGVPHIVGVSNHQGSKATEDADLMAEILMRLKDRKLYFFDSLTSQNSVCREVAAEVGVRYARRDIFLDNSSDIAAIEEQMAKLKKIAFARGKAIAICHDRKNTAAVLARLMPEMAREGIEFVRLSEMEK